MEGQVVYLLIGAAALVLMFVLKTAKKLVRTVLGLAAAAALACFVYMQFIA